jgi:centrosomal protein CEP164
MSDYEDEEEEMYSAILDEEIDPDYQPSYDEILSYAKFLGMDLQNDQAYFYLAKEGLKATIPEPWKPYRNSNGDIYYINTIT